MASVAPNHTLNCQILPEKFSGTLLRQSQCSNNSRTFRISTSVDAHWTTELTNKRQNVKVWSKKEINSKNKLAITHKDSSPKSWNSHHPTLCNSPRLSCAWGCCPSHGSHWQTPVGWRGVSHSALPSGRAPDPLWAGRLERKQSRELICRVCITCSHHQTGERTFSSTAPSI